MFEREWSEMRRNGSIIFIRFAIIEMVEAEDVANDRMFSAALIKPIRAECSQLQVQRSTLALSPMVLAWHCTTTTTTRRANEFDFDKTWSGNAIALYLIKCV